MNINTKNNIRTKGAKIPKSNAITINKYCLSLYSSLASNLYTHISKLIHKEIIPITTTEVIFLSFNI